MATGSDFAWPSVTVKRGSTVVKGRSIFKCSWSDNFGILLEKVGSEFSAEVVIQAVISKMQFFNDIHFFFSFSSRPTDPKFLTGQPEKQQINLEWP